MRRFRQILAIAGLAIIAFFYVSFIAKAISGRSSIPDLMLALSATVVIPVILYILQKLADRLGSSFEDKPENGPAKGPESGPEK